jgi:hypothetical protein
MFDPNPRVSFRVLTLSNTLSYKLLITASLQMIKLKDLAVYWHSGGSPLQYSSTKEMEALLAAAALAAAEKPSHYLIPPVNATVKVTVALSKPLPRIPLMLMVLLLS